MLRIAIIGCGKIADQHVQAIRRLADCEVVAACDRELLMARQLAERFQIPATFADAAQMFQATAIDVVHITTPPQSHFALGQQSLAAGKHVYLEKPFTVTAAEAETLIQLAGQKNLRITAGHNYQFTLEMLEMRKLKAQNYLGGKPVHLESHWPYNLGDVSYVAPILGDRTHWVRQLPGQLFHNLISHGVSKLAEFLDDGPLEIVARGSQSPQLRAMGGGEVCDELRVLIRDASDTTAFFYFSTQLKPGLNQLRICGPANSLLVDHASGTLVRFPNRSYKSYLTFFGPPFMQAREHFRNGFANVRNFLGRRLHQDSGMKELIGQFYASIRAGAPVPIPYREIILTARIMDEIFAQVHPPAR